MKFAEFKKSIGNSTQAPNPTGQRTKYLEALLEIISNVNQSLDPDEVIKIVIRNALQLTGFDKGSIFLVNPVSHELEFRTGLDSEGNLLASESFLGSNTVINDVYQTGHSVFIENALNSNDCRQCKSILKLELQTIFCSPLKNVTGKIGVIYIDSKKLHTIKGNEIIEIFEIMAGQVTASINNAQLHNDLQKLSQIYTRNVVTFMRGDRNRAAAFLGIPRRKLDALLEAA